MLFPCSKKERRKGRKEVAGRQNEDKVIKGRKKTSRQRRRGRLFLTLAHGGHGGVWVVKLTLSPATIPQRQGAGGLTANTQLTAGQWSGGAEGLVTPVSRTPSPRAWRPDFPGAAREAP